MVAAGQEIASLVRRTSATRGVTLVGHSMGGAIAIEAAIPTRRAFARWSSGSMRSTDAELLRAPERRRDRGAPPSVSGEFFRQPWNGWSTGSRSAGSESLKRSIAADMGAAELRRAARASPARAAGMEHRFEMGCGPQTCGRDQLRPALPWNVSRRAFRPRRNRDGWGRAFFDALEKLAEFNAILLRALRDSQSVSLRTRGGLPTKRQLREIPERPIKLPPRLFDEP